MNNYKYMPIAQGLKDSKPLCAVGGYTQEYHALLVQWNVTAENVAYHLAKNDAKFNRNKFLTACGYLPE